MDVYTGMYVYVQHVWLQDTPMKNSIHDLQCGVYVLHECMHTYIILCTCLSVCVSV